MPNPTLMLWTCSQAGCTRGTFINDPAGLASHQTDTGHAPVFGRVISWVSDRSGFMPEILSATPATGPSTGATAFQISGRGLTGATGVKIGTVACTAVSVVSDYQVNATSPAGTANSTQDVSVTTPHGVGVLSGGWKYGA